MQSILTTSDFLVGQPIYIRLRPNGGFEIVGDCKRYATTESLVAALTIKCTCGSDAVKGLAGHHSDWCSKHTGKWKFNHD